MSTLESVGAVRDFVRDVLSDTDADESMTIDVLLAVSELVTNAVVHGGGGPISVQMESSSDEFVCRVRSTGGPLPDPAMWTSPVGGEPSGRGLAIVRALADDVMAEVDGAVVALECRFLRR